MPTRDLFGGAITANFPSELIDASTFPVVVPDSQEILLVPNTDISYLVDILECVRPEDQSGSDYTPEQAARKHFEAIAHDNSNDFFTALWQVDDVQACSPSTSPVNDHQPHLFATLRGTQLVEKALVFKAVRIYLAVFRIAEKNIDVAFSMNIPLPHLTLKAKGATGLPAPNIPTVGTTTDAASGEVETELEDVKGHDVSRQTPEELVHYQIFEEAIKSFKVVDYGLFGTGDAEMVE